mmetsp:Transcript_144776/g.361041  ORF Transcript_144776/g.361041 Transcript_144776/m.361041 type:complete len:269 (-) Transcript_144776:149-955(-)
MGACSGSHGVEDETAEVVLHIYDVSGAPAIKAVNEALRAVGTGAFHAAVEVYGQEWSYGYLERGTGVFACPPKGCSAHSYRESLPMGRTPLSLQQFDQLIAQLSQQWPGRDYDLLRHNCCHFSEELCKHLQVPQPFPSWVKNLAGAGATVNHGVTTAVRAGQAAAIIAAAKAGEIDEKYQIRGTVQAKARDVLAQADERGKRLTEGASVVAGHVVGAVSAGVQATVEAGRATVDAGKAARGVSSEEGYRFGDFTRGVVAKLAPQGGGR